MTTDNNPNPNRNLGYQFYFLFRTYYYSQETELKREPFIGFDSLEKTGIRIDADKRLFRRSIQQPLDNWQTESQKAWKEIREKYHEAFKFGSRDPET